jgi:prepilin-type N-terminal cleavage/methylation domain-containing protein
MVVRRRALRAPVNPDRGFTMVEVIVALMLMTIVLMSGGGFMIHAINSASELSGRQGAVSVANEVLEQIRAVDATFDTTVPPHSALVSGRGQAAVFDQWVNARDIGHLDVSDTYIGTAAGAGGTSFDADAYGVSGTPTVPFQQTINRDNEVYTVNELIGTCGRARTGNACTKLVTGEELYRVVVWVTWASGPKAKCSGATCSFILTSLIDPSRDPQFNASRKPVANADTATTAYLTPVDIGVTTNDSGDFALAGSVVLITTPTHGTATVSNNIVTYTPATGFSGTDPFTYTVTDITGRTSTAGTITPTVTPLAVNDVAAAVNVGTAAFLTDVIANDHGTGLSLVSVTTPSIGTATISGGKISYTPPAAASGLVTMTYTAKDAINQAYTGTLTVTVRPTVAATGTAAICWSPWVLSNSVAQMAPLTLPASAFLGTGPFTISSPALVSGPTGAVVTATGSTLSYTLPKQKTLPQSITYTVVDANSIASTSITMTLKGSCP